jgi:stage V sporulation protein B
MMNAAAMCAAIFVGVVVYLALIVALRAISAEEMRLIPKGEKLAKVLKIS